MGLNRRKMEVDRKAKSDAEAAARRATEKQILEDADHLITVWNERQARRMGSETSPSRWFPPKSLPQCGHTQIARDDPRSVPFRVHGAWTASHAS
jgi:hypothetical protein